MVKKDCKVMFVMTSKEKEGLQKLSEHHDVSMSQVIRVLLRREAKRIWGTSQKRVRRVIR